MSALVAENPRYEAVKIFRIEYADYREAPIVAEHDVKHRATLLMLKEGKEVGRVLWQPDKSAINKLFLAAL